MCIARNYFSLTIMRRYFVSKAGADLGSSERHFFTIVFQKTTEIHEETLRCFWTKVTNLFVL